MRGGRICRAVMGELRRCGRSGRRRGAVDGVDQRAVGDAWDEVADVFVADERRHGFAIGISGLGARMIGRRSESMT